MASTINADNGVVSGSSGLKSTADTSGVLALQSNGTTGLTLNTDLSVTFAGAQTLSAGTANGVTYLNGSKVLTSGSALTFDGTNLGVGANITASAASAPSFTVGTGSGSPAITLYSATNGSSQISFADATSGGGAYDGYILYDQSSQSMLFGRASAENMRLTSTGLGIGTSSPSGKLHVYGGAANTNAYITTATSSGYDAFLNIAGGTSGAAAGVYMGYGADADEAAIYRDSSSALVLRANNAERARITSTGAWSFGSSGTAYGTSGQVLTSAGSGAAPSWASPSGGSWVYLATVSASAAATVSFNSTYITSTYDAYVVVFSGWYPDVDRPQYYLKLSTDNNSTFVTCNFITVRSDSASVQSSATLDSNIRLVSPGTFSTSASNGGGSGCVWIYNPSSTSSGRTVTWTLGGYSTNSSDQESWYGSGTYRNATTAINAIRFSQSSGNITGKFVLYGVKAS